MISQRRGGAPAEHIAIWNGDGWDPFSVPGMNSWIFDFKHDGDDLLAGGGFITAGGEHVRYLARWDGDSWHSFGSGCGSHVASILVDDSDIWVGGTLLSAGGKPSRNIARWTSSTSSVPDEPILTDAGLIRLHPAYPNPCFSSANIAFSLAGNANVNLQVIDPAGRRMMTLASGPRVAGDYTYRWDGRNSAGKPVPPGVYFIRLESAGELQSSKLVLMRR